jgi:hypothetical protein
MYVIYKVLVYVQTSQPTTCFGLFQLGHLEVGHKGQRKYTIMPYLYLLSSKIHNGDGTPKDISFIFIVAPCILITLKFLSLTNAPLYYTYKMLKYLMIAPTCFGSSGPSSGSLC